MKQIIAINNERTKDGKMKGNLFEQALMVEKGLIDVPCKPSNLDPTLLLTAHQWRGLAS